MIHINDALNGVFEFIGGICIWLNVRRIIKDKQTRGVSWPVTVFFFAWGIFNLGYYPSLNQWCSFTGGLSIVAGNCAWLYFAIKYRKN
jgi:hypothetical protein